MRDGRGETTDKHPLWAQKSVLENLIPVSLNVYLPVRRGFHSNHMTGTKGATINTRHKFELPD